jgi:hypothetical protein
MSSDTSTESNARPDAVVSVRFAAEEVAELKKLADAHGIPLSTLIRRTTLRALTWTPAVASLRSNNEAPVASGWAADQSAVQSSWQADANSASVTYSSLGIV